MVDWWSETERAMVECLENDGPMSPEDLAHRVDISESEATAFLCMLAREKKISIRLVGLKDEPAGRPPRGAARLHEKAPASRQATHAGGD